MFPFRSWSPVRNWYGVAVNGGFAPVTSAFSPKQPTGVPVRTTQKRRSRLAPVSWVFGTMKLQSPSRSETQVAKESVTGLLGADVPS